MGRNKRVTRRGRSGVAAGLVAVGVIAATLIPSLSAFADKAEPAVLARAWYWEQQRSQKVPNPSGGDAATLELTNPFCPQPAPGTGAIPGTCREGRLPIQVLGGDYETPDMISAISFDSFAFPLGATVKNFTLTMREADDEQSEPFNADGKLIQACLVTEFFGDGEAREYKERPKFKCSKSDSVAKRKTIKPKKAGDPEIRVWTWDLTDFAQSWTEETPPVAGVMLFPKKGKGSEPGDNNEWRVVFDGPQEKGGVVTSLTFEPPPPPTTIPTTTIPTVTTLAPETTVPPATGTSGTETFTPPGDSGAPAGGSVSADPPTGGDTEVPDDTTPAEPVSAGAEPIADEQPLPPIESFPGYVWLALLAGAFGFSLVRRAVVESATGVRPDGVLAQIRQINAERRGAQPATASGASALGAFFSNIGSKTKSLTSKLPFRKKG